jgi:hypothetical protein
VPARFAVMALLGSLALTGGLSGTPVAGAAAASPCTPRVTAVNGPRAVYYCGPATVVIELGARTYSFRHGLCDRSASARGLELNVGTLVQGAKGNAGQPFVSLLIARSPSESEAFEADTAGRQLFGDTVIAPGATLFAKGTFSSLLGAVFSGSWNCHGVIYDGP